MTIADQAALLPRIRSALPGLRRSEVRIAEAFLADPASSAGLSMSEIAALCDTSTTTVMRFGKRMGYESFRDLRIDLAREATRESLGTTARPLDTGDIDREDSLDDVIAKITLNETLSISDTAENLDRGALRAAIDAIVGSRRIDLFGVGASSVVRLDLQQKLSRIGSTAFGWDDAHAAWTSASVLDAECVAIAISHSGTTRDTLSYLELARRAGARTIAITNFAASPVAEAADIVLTTAARENKFRSGALGSRIAQLMVVDCLFTGIVQASYERSTAALTRTYSAIVESGAR